MAFRRKKKKESTRRHVHLILHWKEIKGMSFPCVISPPSELHTVCLTLISVTSSHSLAFCSPEIIQVGFTNGMIEDPVIDPNVFGSLKCITIKKKVSCNVHMQLSLFSTLWKTSPRLSVVLKMSSPHLVEDSPCAVNTESLRQSGEKIHCSPKSEVPLHV